MGFEKVGSCINYSIGSRERGIFFIIIVICVSLLVILRCWSLPTEMKKEFYDQRL